MAHSHYVIDLFYREAEGSDRFRREVLRIEAADDAEAIAEAVRVDTWRNTDYYAVRAINGSARSADRVVHTSEVKNVPPAEDSAPIEVASGG
ncbi:MAG: hypothetical protein ABIY37_17625 [Devosia sp.]